MKNFLRLLIPGLIFQSVIVGGGYATGRELVAFFFPSGPLGGALGMVVAALVFGAVLAAAFEFARATKSFEYRGFFKELLGPAWVLYEIAYFITLVLVLSVISAAAGELAAQYFGVAKIWGSVGIALVIAVLTYFGAQVIELVLTLWSGVLYLTYILMFIFTFVTFGDDIGSQLQSAVIERSPILSGFQYAAFNVALAPIVLFSVMRLTSRKETISAGLLGGVAAILPALLFYIAMLAHYPQIGDEAVPASYLISALNISWLFPVFQVVVFGTFIETGAALLHGVNQRLEATYEERGKILPHMVRPVVSIFLLVFSVYAASNIGIFSLVAEGYSTLAYVFAAIFIVPLFTIGIWKLRKKASEQ